MTGGSDAAAESRRLADERAARINQSVSSINEKFAGFTPGFYNQRAKDYIDYATPYLSQDYARNQEKASYQLANQGLLRSSAAANLKNSLNQAFNKEQQGIGLQAQGEANDLKQRVAQQQNALIAQAQAGGDPSQSAQAALAAAGSISAPPAFAPVGQFLNNWAAMNLAQQVNSAYGGTQYPSYSFGNMMTRSGGVNAPASRTVKG